MKSVAARVALTIGCSCVVLGVNAPRLPAKLSNKAAHATYALLPNRAERTSGVRSPSGRYGLAWTLPLHPEIDWSRIEWEMTQEDLDDNDSYRQRCIEKYWAEIKRGKIRNVILDTRTRQVAAVIPLHFRRDDPDRKVTRTAGGDFFPWENHGTINGFWSADERRAVLVYDAKFSFDAIYLAQRNGATFQVVEIGDAIENHLRQYLRRTHRAAYDKAHARDVRDPGIYTSDMRLQSDMLTFHVTANTPKDDDHRFLYYEGTMRVKLEQGSRGPRCRILSLRPAS